MSILGNAANSIGGLLGSNSTQTMQAIHKAPYPTPGGLYPDPYAADKRDVYYPVQGELGFHVKPVENGYLVTVTTAMSTSTYIAAEFKDVHDIIDLAAVKSKLNASS
jgi:hypothetical protein